MSLYYLNVFLCYFILFAINLQMHLLYFITTNLRVKTEYIHRKYLRNYPRRMDPNNYSSSKLALQTVYGSICTVK